ncbi:MAG: hypothetical protein IPO36_18710 [Anaerolineales bacterium]|nr:hypothetical protein [Anaerolineales bacterium]
MELQFETVTWPVPAVWAVGLVVLLIGFIGFWIQSAHEQKITAAEVQAEAKIREAENKMILAAHETGEQQTDNPGLLRLKKKMPTTRLKWMEGSSANPFRQTKSGA